MKAKQLHTEEMAAGSGTHTNQDCQGYIPTMPHYRWGCEEPVYSLPQNEYVGFPLLLWFRDVCHGSRIALEEE